MLLASFSPGKDTLRVLSVRGDPGSGWQAGTKKASGRVQRQGCGDVGRASLKSIVNPALLPVAQSGVVLSSPAWSISLYTFSLLNRMQNLFKKLIKVLQFEEVFQNIPIKHAIIN